jgi:uncharacterized phage-like protein YoqJ
MLHDAVIWLRDQRGMKTGISGLALGVDTWWAQAVLDAGLDLWTFVPFGEQPARWNKTQRAEWQRLRAAAARDVVVDAIPDGVPTTRRGTVVNQLLHRRNRAMVHRADAVIAVWEPHRTSGGTYHAIQAASGKPLIHINPTDRRVHQPLPGA